MRTRIITYKKKEAPSNYDVDYQAILDYADSNGIIQPSIAVKNVQNQLILDLKSSGVWSKLDLFHFFINDGSKEFAYINWIDPNSYFLIANNDSNVELVSNEGLKRTGTNIFNTGFNPSLNGVNYTLNNASFGYKLGIVGSGLGTDGYIMRAGVNGLTQTGGGLWLYDASYGAKIYLNNQDELRFGNTYRYISSTDNTFLVCNRIDSTNIHLYQDGNYLTDTLTSVPTTGLPNHNLIYGSGLDTVVQFCFLGSDLTATEIGNFNVSINDYLTAIQ